MLNPADAAFISALETALPAKALRQVQPGDLEEPRGAFHGQAAAVATPGTVEEVTEDGYSCKDD